MVDQTAAAKVAANQKAMVVKICTVIACYFCISISLVFVNKILMQQLQAPMFIIWFQCVCTALICWGLGKMAMAQPKTGGSAFIKQFPSQAYTPSIGLQLAPLSCVFVAMVTFNQFCLRDVEVSFYNTARALTICINVPFSYLLLHKSTSVQAMLCLLVVTSGFILGSGGEVNFSLRGSLYGICASTFVSLNSIFTKKLLYTVDNNKWRLAFYNNMNACVLFLPFIYFSGELDVLRAHTHLLLSPAFLVPLVFTGFLGFLIGIATVAQINLTSPLSHNVIATAKACVQTAFAYQIWKNEATWMSHVGNGIVIGGSLLYAYVRVSEDNAREMKKAEVKKE